MCVCVAGINLQSEKQFLKKLGKSVMKILLINFKKHFEILAAFEVCHMTIIRGLLNKRVTIRDFPSISWRVFKISSQYLVL